VSIVTVASGGAVLQTVEYEYDIDDRRVRKTVTSALPTGGVVENYFIDRDQIAFVTDGNGDRTFHYLYGLNVDQVLAQDSSTGMVWALADRLGSIDTLTDKDGVVVDKRTFDSFGQLLSESNPMVSFRYGYTGRERDLESGLSYYRARYYDPNVGRFISVDPIGFEGGDTNLYRYVGNNSTNDTDPTGLYSWNDFGRDARNFGQSIGRNFDYSFDAVNTHVLQPINNTVVKPVFRAANTYVIEPFNYGASTAVNYYTDLVLEGQQEGGVGGFIKQGAGILGGTFASVPGATAQFVQANGTRLGGAAKAVGGAIQVGVGLGTTATVFGAPIGAPVVANGVDNLQAGLRQLWTGENTNTLLYDSIKRVTGSDKLAGTVDVATNAVLNTATAVDAARRAATLADARTVAAEAAVLRQEARALVKAEKEAAKAARSPQCFVAGTEIQTINGTKNIEDIHVGDWVLSDDPTTPGDIEYKQVLQTFAHDTTKFVDVYIGGEKITTTEEHPFWVPDVGWVAAKDLHAGSHLQTKYESWLDVDKVVKHSDTATVYNFEVEGFHTYFVSDLGLLVHNTCIPDPWGNKTFSDYVDEFEIGILNKDRRNVFSDNQIAFDDPFDIPRNYIKEHIPDPWGRTYVYTAINYPLDLTRKTYVTFDKIFGGSNLKNHASKHIPNTSRLPGRSYPRFVYQLDVPENILSLDDGIIDLGRQLASSTRMIYPTNIDGARITNVWGVTEKGTRVPSMKLINRQNK
jgi:RHS repeat-associated protein